MRRPKGPSAPGTKYKNTAVVVDGIRFDSLKELRRYQELGLLERAGCITQLERQVSFLLIPTQVNAVGKTEICVRYVSDFTYRENGHLVVEDVKSEITRKVPAYVIKRKLMLERYGVTIREV